MLFSYSHKSNNIRCIEEEDHAHSFEVNLRVIDKLYYYD